MSYIKFGDPFVDFEKFLVGKDQVAEQYARMVKQASEAVKNYPPYNIKKVDDNKYVIEMAVAGFGKQDIELTLEDGTLTINGKLETVDQLTADGIKQTFLHKGIADRGFTRKFTLADNVEVRNADLFNGMLKVWLEAIIPESKKPKKIPVNSDEETTLKTQILKE
jgi:molecular chaperone IbpA